MRTYVLSALKPYSVEVIYVEMHYGNYTIKILSMRKFYIGLLFDYLLGELVLKAIEAGNSKNTNDYLEYLLADSPDQRLLIFWDGASYNRSKEIRGFLDSVNQSLPTDQ